MTATRTVDELDRVKLVHSSDVATPDVTYTYDTPCAFGKGRLCSITQGSTQVGYAYDRFGRVTPKRCRCRKGASRFKNWSLGEGAERRGSAEAGGTGAVSAGVVTQGLGGALLGASADELTQLGRVETEEGLFVQRQFLGRSLFHLILSFFWPRRPLYTSSAQRG